MTDHLDRAAEVIEQATPADVPGYRMRYAVEAARALEDAGLLVSPERDAAGNGFTWEHATRFRPVRVPCDCDNPTHAVLAGDDSPPTHASLEVVPSRRLVGPWIEMLDDEAR